MDNIILIGMPGCGKTTVARALAAATGREAAESDDLICEKAGMTIPEILDEWGETCFRALESAALTALCKRDGHVIAAGSGCVTQAENEAILRGGGAVLWLLRDLDKLPTPGQPLSVPRALRELYAEREPLYRRFAERAIDNNGTVEETIAQIRRTMR